MPLEDEQSRLLVTTQTHAYFIKVMSDSKMNYVYKLVPSSMAIPDILPERLPVSDLDSKSGFIHLSTASQVPNTLKFFFAEESQVFVLRLKYDDIEKDVRWEDPKAEVCGPRADEGMFPVRMNASIWFLSPIIHFEYKAPI